MENDIEKRYNYYHKKIIAIGDGERFCPKCNGKGKIFSGKEFYLRRIFNIRLTCDKCLGDGKIDWVEQAIGKQSKEIRNVGKRTSSVGSK
jgi:DnaJ-class molecular chaperone